MDDTKARIQTLGRRAMAEGVGTFFLVLIGTGTIVVAARGGGVADLTHVALAFGFVIMAMVYAIGHLSGGHLNPAVTLAFWSIRRFPSTDALVYVASQCAGAVAASLVLWGLLGEHGGMGATTLASDIAPAEGFAIEWLLSFALMFVITAVATDERVVSGFAGLAVGLTVAFDVFFGATLTGASMNPARSLGPAFASGIWDEHWLYWLAPILGMVAAAWTYEALRAARSPDLSERRIRRFGVEGPIGPIPGAPGGKERRGGGRGPGPDRRVKDIGPPPGVPERRKGGDRRGTGPRPADAAPPEGPAST